MTSNFSYVRCSANVLGKPEKEVISNLILFQIKYTAYYDSDAFYRGSFNNCDVKLLVRNNKILAMQYLD